MLLFKNFRKISINVRLKHILTFTRDVESLMSRRTVLLQANANIFLGLKIESNNTCQYFCSCSAGINITYKIIKIKPRLLCRRRNISFGSDSKCHHTYILSELKRC